LSTTDPSPTGSERVGQKAVEGGLNAWAMGCPIPYIGCKRRYQIQCHKKSAQNITGYKELL